MDNTEIVNITSLNYIGAKKTLLPYLNKVISETLESSDILCDLFAGSGIVGSYFRQKCKGVISNDIELYSYVINRGLLTCDYTIKISDIIQDINDRVLHEDNLKPDISKDLIYKHFSPSPGCERMYFTCENAVKIDRSRQEIERLHKDEIITLEEYHFLLGSILVSADKLANTTSLYCAYLKAFKKSAIQTFILKPLHTLTKSSNTKLNKVFNMDAQSLAEEWLLGKEGFDILKEVDVVYVDPPYCARQYGANYSPLNYMVEYSDENELTGKTGILKDYFRSDFARKPNVKAAFSDIVKMLQPKKAIFISYNSESLLSQEEMKNVFLKHGDVILYKKLYRRFKSNVQTDSKQVYELLYRIDCRSKTNSYIENEVL